MQKPRTGLIVTTGALLLALLTLFWCAVAKVDLTIAREHGPMENFQAVALLLGTLTFGLLAMRTDVARERWFCAAACLLYFTFLLLEFDVRPFERPLLTFLLNGPVRNVVLLGAWIYILVRAYRNKGQVISFVWSWLRSPSGVLLILSGLCWLGGAVAEKVPFMSGSQFTEELFEVHACLLMLVAALQARSAMSAPQMVRPPELPWATRLPCPTFRRRTPSERPVPSGE